MASINNAGNAQFNGTLQVGGPSTFTNSTTVKNQVDAEIDSFLWAGATANQKESYTYKDYTGASQWYMVKDASNNWALNSATGGLDSFKAYQSSNSGDTYINASNPTGHIRLNYETGSGAETDIYSGASSGLVAAFLGSTAIKFPGLAAASGHNCLQIDNSGYISNSGSGCGSSQNGTVNTGNSGQVAYYTGNGNVIAGMNAVAVNAGGTGASSATQALQNLGAQAAITGLASDGASGIAVTGNVMAGSIGNFLYASRYPGQTNTGIKSTFADSSKCGSGCMVVADPGYPSLEQYSPTNNIPNWASSSTFQDLRGGKNANVFHNWGYNNNLYGDANNPAALFYGQMDGSYPGANTTHQNLVDINLLSTTPGYSQGYPSFGGLGWQVTNALSVNHSENGSGISEALGCAMYKYGIGDAVCGYFYLFADGGNTTLADEADKSVSASTNEDPWVLAGTCASGCTTGSSLVKLTIPTNVAGKQGTYRYLIDTTQPFTATTVTNIAAGLNSSMSAVTVADTVPVSTAWGTLASNVATPVNEACTLSSSSLTSVANASGGSTVYTGAITNGGSNGLSGCAVNITGFGNGANNGAFTVSASTATSITVNNASGVLQSGTATEIVLPFTTLETFNVNLTTGTFTTGLACFSSMYHDQALITSAWRSVRGCAINHRGGPQATRIRECALPGRRVWHGRGVSSVYTGDQRRHVSLPV